MRDSSSAAVQAHGDASIVRGWPALALVAIVLAAAVYSFAPRPNPPFPETVVRSDQLQVNGIVRDGSRLIAVGEQGHIMLADSPQGPWSAAGVNPPRGSNFNQVLVAGGAALAVGHDAWIVRSTDRGANWKEVSFNKEQSDPLLGIAGPFDGKIYSFGAFGLFMSSSDQGVTWIKEAHPALADRHLNAMARLNDGSLLIVGERGLLARSTDAGQTWQALPEIYPGSFFGVLRLPGDGVIAFGMRGNAFVSPDNGRSWKKSNVPEVVSLFAGAVTDNGEIMLAGASNAVFVSTDGGANFRRVSQNMRRDLVHVLPLEGGARLTAGEGGIRLFQPGGK